MHQQVAIKIHQLERGSDIEVNLNYLARKDSEIPPGKLPPQLYNLTGKPEDFGPRRLSNRGKSLG